MHTSPLTLSVLLLPTFLCGLAPAPARAQSCRPTAFRSPRVNPDAASFAIEGRLAGIDLHERTFTVHGIEFHVPPEVLLDVDGDELGDLSFDDVFFSPWEAVHPLLGGNTIATGRILSDGPQCFDRVADFVHVEVAEHVLVGPISRVSPSLGEVEIAGVPVRMNVDPRLPARLTGLAGTPLSIADLQGFVGSLAAVEGYYEHGVLRALFLETDAWVASAATDTVLIERAQWDHSKLAIEVRGFVTRDPAGHLPVSSLQIFLGDWTGTACGGALAATVATTYDPALDVASFRYRSPDQSHPAPPQRACVSSVGGGGASRPLAIH